LPFNIALGLTVLLAAQGAPAPRAQVAVTGQVVTRDGGPAAAVRVSAIPAPPPGTRPNEGQNYWVAQQPAATTLTDAQGRYRLSVGPGRFFVAAGMIGAATYYPAETDVEKATVVTLATAPQVLDIKLANPLAGRVRGRLTPAPAAGGVERAVLSGLRMDELLEVVIAADGTFEFGHVANGRYLLSVAPTPPGMSSLVFDVGSADVSVNMQRPVVRQVRGRLVVQNGPLPQGTLAFSTPSSYVVAAIGTDGTFTAQLQEGQHRVELSGMPVGYTVASVRVGARDTTPNLTIASADLPDVVVTVGSPRAMTSLRGRVTGAAGGRVAITGPIFGVLETPLRADGSFEFNPIPSGLYRVSLPGVAAFAPVNVVVDWRGNDVQIAAP
jgi:hypothetical protein